MYKMEAVKHWMSLVEIKEDVPKCYYLASVILYKASIVFRQVASNKNLKDFFLFSPIFKGKWNNKEMLELWWILQAQSK